MSGMFHYNSLHVSNSQVFGFFRCFSLEKHFRTSHKAALEA